MSTPSSRKALHELGHAYVAMFFGFRVGVIRLFFDDVGLISRDGTYTIGAYMMHSEKLSHVDPDQWATVMLAGKWAVLELDPASRGTAEAEIGPNEDIRRVRVLFEALDPEHADQRFQRADSYAHALVIKYARQITAPLKDFVKRGSMTGEELRTFLA